MFDKKLTWRPLTDYIKRKTDLRSTKYDKGVNTIGTLHKNQEDSTANCTKQLLPKLPWYV